MGYVFNDNRESGGILDEHDTCACNHCQSVVPIRHWIKQGGWCWGCGKPVCYPCAERAKIHGCESWKKQIDQELDRQAREQAWRRLGVG